MPFLKIPGPSSLGSFHLLIDYSFHAYFLPLRRNKTLNGSRKEPRVRSQRPVVLLYWFVPSTVPLFTGDFYS